MNIRDYLTENEAQTHEVYMETNSHRKTAERLGKCKATVTQTLKRAREKLQAKGYSPEHGMIKPTLEHLRVIGHSDLEDVTTGETKLRWMKYGQDHDKIGEMIKETIRSLSDEVPRIKQPSLVKANRSKDIIPWFQVGDAHVGMLAYKAEVGHNFDMKIAERELCIAISLLIDETPYAERCVIQDLGDFTHYENEAGLTEASGHNLDIDTRYNRMIRVYSRMMRFIVTAALAKFKHVDVIINQGNHSRKNDMWMAELLGVAFSECDRLTVLDNSGVFIAYRMGNTFVLCHHSDKCKPERLPGVMATDFAQDWGETLYRYIDSGHVHHRAATIAKEMPGAIWESWNQLAPSDKYAHDNGYRSRSFLTVVDRSRTYGEVGRRTIPVERIKDMIDKLEPGESAKARREVYTV